jgi:hypothetical protein
MRSPTAANTFESVAAVALTLPEVDATTKYDGSPVLRLGGAFLAGMAMHPSAHANTLVVRIDPDDREWLLADAPDTYYLTDFYRPHPVVLVRLDRLAREALPDLLAMSWRATRPKARMRGASSRQR